MSEQTDISRLLFTLFEGMGDSGVSRADVIRLWSLEMQWFSPEDAERIVDALGAAGWLATDDGGLSLAPGVELSIPGLGWRPITRRMLNPPSCEARPSPIASQQNPTFSKPRVSTRSEPTAKKRSDERSFDRPVVTKQSPGSSSEQATRQAHPVDRAEGSIPVLIDIIARESGLENKEVVRRAQRKRRALGPVPLWMALALVAREQGLAMQSVSYAIDRASH